MQISAVLPGHIVGTADVFRKRREGRKKKEEKEMSKKVRWEGGRKKEKESRKRSIGNVL